MDYLISTKPIHEASSINNTISPKRKSKTISNKNDLDLILSITHTKAENKSTLMDLFADFGEGPRFNPYDIITVPKGYYGGLSDSKDLNILEEAGFWMDKNDNIIEMTHDDLDNGTFNIPAGLKYHPTSSKKNTEPIVTTAGMWLFNKIFIEPICDILGYINKPMTKNVYGGINDILSQSILESKISIRQLKNFIDNSQILLNSCSVISPSYTEELFMMNAPIEKKKAELLSKPEVKKALENTDLTAMKKVEEELISFTKNYLKDAPVCDLYNSGATKASGDNTIKNMYLMRGATMQSDGSYGFIKSSYMSGLTPDEYVAAGDSSIVGGFARSKLTASGGYAERVFLNTTIDVQVLGKGSDCGTKRYIEVELTEKNKNNWIYSFIIEGNKIVELTSDNIDKYVGKKVKMRFSALCEAKDGKICEHCAGSLFRRIGISNAGMTSSIPMSALKNANMVRLVLLQVIRNEKAA